MDRCDEILTRAFRESGSEVHIQANLPVVLFNGGQLFPTEYWPASVEESDELVKQFLGEDSSHFLERRGWATGSGHHRAGRYRVSAYRERDALGARLRLFPHHVLRRGVPLPPLANDLVGIPSGLVLVAGPPGSGVTTALASLSRLARKSGRQVLSLEQPVEYEIPDVTQFGVAQEPFGWAEAYLSARGGKHDVVAISQLESVDSVEAAMELAERGKLIFAALNANHTVRAIRQTLEGLDESGRDERARRLADVLKGVLACRLVSSFRGPRLIFEELSVNSEISEMIAARNWTRLRQSLEQGEHGITLEKNLAAAVDKGLVAMNDVLESARDIGRSVIQQRREFEE